MRACPNCKRIKLRHYVLYFFETLRLRNPILFYFGLACFAAALLCLPALKYSTNEVQGVNAWYKPLKFFLATGIYVWTMAWILKDLQGADRLVFWFSWSMVLLFSFEDVYIALQAYRSQLSHFNLSSPFYRTMYAGMAIASAGISVWTAIVLARFMGKLPEIPESYLWGIRLGLFLFVVFSLQGFIMGSRLSHTVGAADGGQGLPLTQWSKTHGDLRIAHFLGMHGLQILPLAGWLLRNKWLTLLAGVVYGLIVLMSLIQALQGKALWHANGLMAVVFLYGLSSPSLVFPAWQ
jgi:hypothetical protein